HVSVFELRRLEYDGRFVFARNREFDQKKELGAKRYELRKRFRIIPHNSYLVAHISHPPMTKKSIYILISLITIAIALFFFSLQPVSGDSAPVVFEIQRGESFHDVVRDLV